MGEVSEMFDVKPSLIRFWEQKFDILKPDKNKKGNRLFTPADVENLKLIYHLVKENGMTLSGAQKRLKANTGGMGKNLEVIDKLEGIKSMLLEVKQELLKGGDSEIIMEEPAFPAEISIRPHPAAEALTDSRPEETTLTAREENIIPDTNMLPDEKQAATAAAGLPDPVKMEPADEEPAARKPQVIEQTLF